MKKIKQIRKNIPVATLNLAGNEKKYVLDCIKSTWISSAGAYINKFEDAFAKYIGIKHAITCSNGTTALHLALLALGITSGDEVVCPTFTYVATANSIMYAGATPVFVDCDNETFNIDPQKIESVITEKTKAIIIAPLYGHPCEYDEIKHIAKKYNLYLIDDSAESLGATYNGKRCGSLADISTFSFFGNKVVTCGEGGMVVTNNDEWVQKIRFYKNQGMSLEKRYWFDAVGYNYRMTNIQAAIGLAQLERIDLSLKERQKIAKLYTQKLQSLEKHITIPITRPHSVNSYWMYSILVKNRRDRDKLMKYLKEAGIDTRPFFYPMHFLPMYKDKYKKTDVSVSTDISARGISLPTFFGLKKDEISYITDHIKNYFS